MSVEAEVKGRSRSSKGYSNEDFWKILMTMKMEMISNGPTQLEDTDSEDGDDSNTQGNVEAEPEHNQNQTN